MKIRLGMVAMVALLPWLPARAQPAAEATAPAQPAVDAAAQKEIAQVRRRIVALLARIKAREEEIAKLPPDAPGVAGAPGAEAMPPAMPPPPGAPPMDPAMMPPGMEGVGAPAGSRRQRLIEEQQRDFALLAELQGRMRELEAGPQESTLAEENVEALHPLGLYTGSVEKNPFGLSIGSWGSGAIEETEYGLIDGHGSLLVSTDGYYRGVRLDFATPPDIKRYFETPDRSYLVLDVYFFREAPQATQGQPGMEGMAPGMEAMPPGMEAMPPPPMEGMPPGMGAPPGMPGMPPPPGMEALPPPGMDPAMAPPPGMEPGMMPGMEGMPAMPAAPATPQGELKTTSLRVVLDTDLGPVSIEDLYFDDAYEAYPGWTRVLIPVRDLVNPSERVPTVLKRLRLFGDATDDFYVGSVQMFSDEVPITPQIVGPQEITAVAGEEVRLEGVVDAGLSVVSYTWDWGDGEQDEVDEPFGSHMYIKPGTYTVTLTANDIDKLKEPGKTTISIVVKPFSEQARPAAQPGMPAPMP